MKLWVLIPNAVLRSPPPPWEDLEWGRDLTDCLRCDWPEDYAPVEERNKWNGFVCGKDKMPKRVLIRDSFMRKMPDGHWVEQRSAWEALELLVFEMKDSYKMGVTPEGKEIWVNRTVYVAARDWDEATRIYNWHKDRWMNCGLICGWMNFWTDRAINAEKKEA
ncbi:MAG: hypothetical protein IJH64_03045 [Oscillospiraceae bacterium]|nr:hypothetical protein [Oscillospiraceae bacterium]